MIPEQGNLGIALGVQRLSKEHIPAIVRLEYACFPTCWSVEQYRASMAGGQCRVFGIIQENILLAYLSVSWQLAIRECEVLGLAVAPAYRRMGLGEKMLHSVLHTAAQEGIILALLEVRVGNAAARALYEKVGFTQQGVRKGYYTEPVEDALLYSLDCSYLFEDMTTARSGR